MVADGPDRDRARYSFRRAYETDAFQQADLQAVGAFGKEAKARGVNLSFGSHLRDQLEALDRVGAFRPVAFDTGSDGFVFREEVAFAPWESYTVVEDEVERVLAYYSHWQLLYVQDAVEFDRVSVSIDWLLDETRQRELGDGAREFYARQRERWQSIDDDWRQRTLLLVRIQNRYFPVIRGTLTKITTSLVYDPEVSDFVNPYRKTAREFDPATVLDELGLAVEDIKQAHQQLAARGITRDPLERFHMLFRMAPYRERSKLKNEARRAQDAFDAAEMLRRFYHDLTGELLPTPDEIFDGRRGAWKEQFFGHGPRLRYDRHDLQVELRLHHLDPHIVHLIVEGESDELVFRGLIEALGGSAAPALGITFSNLDGIGRTRLHTKLLRAAKSYSRFPVLVVDREGDIERDVELLKAEGLLSDETAFLWKASLEEDNFTDEELVAAAARIAERKDCQLKLHAAELRSARDSQKERLGKDAPGLAEVLLSLTRNPEHGAVLISKPEFAQELVQLLLDEREREDDQEALMKQRPVLNIIFSIIRIT